MTAPKRTNRSASATAWRGACTGLLIARPFQRGATITAGGTIRSALTTLTKTGIPTMTPSSKQRGHLQRTSGPCSRALSLPGRGKGWLANHQLLPREPLNEPKIVAVESKLPDRAGTGERRAQTRVICRERGRFSLAGGERLFSFKVDSQGLATMMTLDTDGKDIPSSRID